jgi:hypothetical protein
MKVSIYILLYFSFSVFFMMVGPSVYATSWVEIEPQDIVDRADAILMGEYDFTSDPKPMEFVFQGLEFHIKTVYKGEAAQQEIVGIDYYDMGWAKEFQEEGGEFLLFLEKDKEADFLIPISGANGMVLVQDGEVKAPNKERKLVFENYLESHSGKTLTGNGEFRRGGKQEGSFLLLYVGAGVAAGIIVCFLIYRYKRKSFKGSEEKKR